MSNTFKIQVYPKGNDLDSKGLVPLYVRITVNGKRWEISLKRKINPSKWCKKSGRLKDGRLREYEKDANHYIEQVKARIFQIEGRLISSGKTLTANQIKRKFHNNAKKSKSLLEVYDNHNCQIERLVGRDFFPE